MSEEQNTETYTETNESHLGPILAVLLIVLVLILGGLYLWGAQLSKDMGTTPQSTRVNNEPETTRAEADTAIFSTVSTSNTIGAIEADLMSTNLDELDTEINAIEAEVNKVAGE